MSQSSTRPHLQAGERAHVSKVLHDVVQESLAAIVESSDDAIISKTLDGIIQSWNKGAERIFGYTAEETIGQHITLLIPPERINEEYDIIQRLKNGQRIDHFETVRVAKDGKRLDISLTISPVRDSTGHIIGASKVARDITEKKRAERELAMINEQLETMVKERTAELEDAQRRDRANLNRFKSMISNLSIGAVAIDENFMILEANDLFCSLFGVPFKAADLVGKHGSVFSKLFREKIQDLDAFVQRLEHIQKEQKPVVGDEIHLKDGHIILRDYLPVFDGDIYRGQLLLFRDVTHERRMDRTKSEFMSLASHQLRTPLTAIRWSMSRLSKNVQDKLAPSEQQLFRQGYEAAVRMSVTIDAMLQISRIEAGQVRVQKKELALAPFLETIISALKPLSQEKNQILTYDCLSDVTLNTDPVLLEEVLNNLVTNAVKYTPQRGKVRIAVTSKEGNVSISVTDTGYGIPKLQQQNIFQKFFRGDNVVLHDTEGTGIGLYLSALIVKLLGGSIDFTSEEGKGSVFMVTLPSAM